jgi:hypothetical protein
MVNAKKNVPPWRDNPLKINNISLVRKIIGKKYTFPYCGDKE